MTAKLFDLPMSHTVYFNLNILYDDYLSFYQGVARSVSVVADDGRRIEFPAKLVQRHLTREGIHGRFELSFDEHHKLIALRRMA